MKGSVGVLPTAVYDRPLWGTVSLICYAGEIRTVIIVVAHENMTK